MSDPFNEFGIFFINFYFLCIFIAIIYYPYDLTINQYMFNKFTLTNVISGFLYFLGNQFPSYTYQLFLLFLILYLILYAFYLFIIYVVPETGPNTLFIPIRELLLAIPPLPLLINKGVFKMFDNFFSLFGGAIKFKDFLKNYVEFSKENIIQYIRMFNPDIDILITEVQKNNSNDNSNTNDNSNSNIIDTSKNDVDVCIDSQTPITTPDMNFIDSIMNQITHSKNSIRCNLNSIKSYIKTSANQASMEATDSINKIND